MRAAFSLRERFELGDTLAISSEQSWRIASPVKANSTVSDNHI
jgi:hypothetical protein